LDQDSASPRLGADPEADPPRDRLEDLEDDTGALDRFLSGSLGGEDQIRFASEEGGGIIDAPNDELLWHWPPSGQGSRHGQATAMPPPAGAAPRVYPFGLQRHVQARPRR
jgi:hypothetical protein